MVLASTIVDGKGAVTGHNFNYESTIEGQNGEPKQITVLAKRVLLMLYKDISSDKPGSINLDSPSLNSMFDILQDVLVISLVFYFSEPSAITYCYQEFHLVLSPAPTPATDFLAKRRKWAVKDTRTKVSFFPGFLTSRKDPKVLKLKEELLMSIEPLDMGADATPDDQQRIDQLKRKLEAVNPTREPLKSDLLNGKWQLIYTTSKSLLQNERPKFLRSRVNYQAINLDTIRAQNMETCPFFNQVTAELLPINSRKVAVKLDFQNTGTGKNGDAVKAPERTQYGSLDITYLDEDLRVSTGDKGNLFILKMVDRLYKVPR
ncbi:probable plastid-lipid-associated protein 4, chloroplastic [Chenopodium quinoa]|uniref:probable plastid-lipid-associated protein 4, chloroplastic n=1 Tax=Chenopodium quinoa TaxID=63459 RepID=UPI000B78B9F7|nr:probable plastid-lipid-associated protein 4, chloroplastic [Chenopodium quinoa]